MNNNDVNFCLGVTLRGLYVTQPFIMPKCSLKFELLHSLLIFLVKRP